MATTRPSNAECLHAQCPSQVSRFDTRREQVRTNTHDSIFQVKIQTDAVEMNSWARFPSVLSQFSASMKILKFRCEGVVASAVKS